MRGLACLVLYLILLPCLEGGRHMRVRATGFPGLPYPQARPPGPRRTPGNVSSINTGPLVVYKELTASPAYSKVKPLPPGQKLSTYRKMCKSGTNVAGFLLSALASNARLMSKYTGKSVVFVGSSWSLHGKGLGALIDSYDIVIRINSAPVQGYEADVGSKTTHRCLSSVQGACYGDRHCAAQNVNKFWANNPGVKIIPMAEWTIPMLLKALHKDARQASQYAEPIDCVRGCVGVVKLWLTEAAKKVPGLRPQAITALMLRAGFCCLFSFVMAGFVPSIAGFDLSCTPKAMPMYYYDPSVPNLCNLDMKGHHDVLGETAILRNFVDVGLVTFLGGR